MRDYTRIPNYLFDLDLNTYEFRIIMFIARKTIGWDKESDGISLSQFTNHSKSSKATVIKFLKSLEAKKLIIIIKEKNNKGHCTNVYQIVNQIEKGSKRDLQVVAKEICKCSKRDLQVVAKEICRHKETNTKDTITKEKETKKKNEIVKINILNFLILILIKCKNLY